MLRQVSTSAPTRASNSSCKPNLLRSGSEYFLTPPSPGSQPIRLKTGRVEQRNWSRVGSAVMSNAVGDRKGKRVFVKQYVDSLGSWHDAIWSNEWAAAEIATQLLYGIVHVPENLCSDQSMRVNVFEYLDVITPDKLLRRDSECFERMFPTLLLGAQRLLGRLQDGSAKSFLPRELAAKRRDFGGPSVAVNFKGLEVRNVGFRLDDKGEVGPALVVFDFGSAYLAPIEEAAAKLYISVGLLNWGKPLQRFAKGPDLSLLARCRESLDDYLDSDALQAELHLQKSFRMAEVHGHNRVERAMKRFVIHHLGADYLQKLEGWCLAEFSSR